MAIRSDPRPQLEQFFDEATEPVCLVDARRRIAYVNVACARWLALDPGRLLGCECRYHSLGDVDEGTAAAAALCPPPAALAGRRMTTFVTHPAREGLRRRRKAEFIPLGKSAGGSAVLVVMAAEDEAESNAGSADPVAKGADPHGLVDAYRRRLANCYQVDRLFGESPQIRRVREQVRLASASDSSVLIMGPPGCGRQHVARAIHYGRHGMAKGARFVPLACSLVAGELLESTVAALVRSRAGQPAGPLPTLLLNDVDRLAPESQRALVELLSPRHAVRVIATSRRSLLDRVGQDAVRSDLTALLSTLEISLPPLVDRRPDLPLLAQAIIEDENARGAKQVGGLHRDALELLSSYWWPGDVDELADCLRHAHAEASGPEIAVDDLPLRIRTALSAQEKPPAIENIVLDDFLKEVERELVRRALAKSSGNKAQAARLLGLTRPRLYRRMVQLGMIDEENSA